MICQATWFGDFIDKFIEFIYLIATLFVIALQQKAESLDEKVEGKSPPYYNIMHIMHKICVIW